MGITLRQGYSSNFWGDGDSKELFRMTGFDKQSIKWCALYKLSNRELGLII
ncbi:hypothetical protein LguiA_033871 [Lonicera macranthoides]